MSKGNMSILCLISSSKKEDYEKLQEILWSPLDFFGMPYRVADLAKNDLTPEVLKEHSVIVIGQEHLGESLSERDTEFIVDAVESGVGLVIFDGHLHSYRNAFKEDLGLKTTREATHGSRTDTLMVRVCDNKHFITGAKELEFIRFKKPLEVGNIFNIEREHRLLMVEANMGCPALVTETCGKGRVVLYAISPNIWLSEFFGHGGGLDDVFWRSIVWAARKPFVMLAMPPFVTMRIDDCSGAGNFEWVRILNRHGFIPHVSLFTENLSERNVQSIKQLYNNGLAEFSYHAFTWTKQIFWKPQSPTNHNEGEEFSGDELKESFRKMDDLQDKWGIEWSRVLTAHFGEVGKNVIPFLKERGIAYLGIPYVFSSPYGVTHLQLPEEKSKGLKPFSGQGGVIDRHPDFPEFFMVCPRYDILPESVRQMLIARGVLTPKGQTYDFLWETVREKVDVKLAAWYAAFGIKLCLDNLSPVVLVTHEQKIAVLNNEEWDRILLRTDELTANYEKIFKSWSHIAGYAENLQNSKIAFVNFDQITGAVECHLEGQSNMPLYLHVFKGESERVERSFKETPPHEGGVKVRFKPTDLLYKAL